MKCLFLVVFCLALASAQPPPLLHSNVKKSSSIIHSSSSTSTSSSSSSSSSNSSSHRGERERKSWDRTHLDDGHTKVFKSNSKVNREESGSDSFDLAKNEAAGSRDVKKSALNIDGKDVHSTEKGSSSSMSSSNTSSGFTEFSKAIAAEISKETIHHRADLNCVAKRQINVFIIIHLDSRWYQKLQFLREFVNAAYEEGRVNIFCVYFNKIVKSFATFGVEPLKSKSQLLAKIDQIAASMERRTARLWWHGFRLDRAVSDCFEQASLYLPDFGLNDRPSLLVTNYDNTATVTDSVLQRVRDSIPEPKRDPFRLKVSVVKPVNGYSVNTQNQRKLDQLERILASSDTYRLRGMRLDSLLSIMAKLIGRDCEVKYMT